MDVFTVKLAEIPIGVSALFSSTRHFFRDYLSEEAPRFSVCSTMEGIAYERGQAAKEDDAVGGPRRRFSDAYLETLALLRAIADRLIEADVVLFHGTVLAVDGKAYLFTAPSGTGKTTHARLWLQQVPGAYILNGDKPFLKRTAQGVLACGNPWQGKENYGCRENLPLAAICFVERGTQNEIRPIRMDEALGRLLCQTHFPEGPESRLKAVQLAGDIGCGVKLYLLRCNMEPEAARVSSAAMLETQQ